MTPQKILIIGGGIGGLTSAMSLCRKGIQVELIEKDPDWSVYGVGIIQQSNVVRAMAELGILDKYLDAGFGFDGLEMFSPAGVKVATIPSPKLVPGYPANVGIARPALHKVLGDCAKAAGAKIRLGVTAVGIQNQVDEVRVQFSDGREDRFDLVIGADGLYSTTRTMIFPDAPKPEYTGQAVWRYNFARPADLINLQAFEGPIGMGLVPLSKSLMYMFLTTAEPGNPRYPTQGLAAAMRSKLAHAPPNLRELVSEIKVDAEVVYKPLEWLLITGDWHSGRVVLIGDAVHATTPHLGQGAGMAIEDSIVLADELTRNNSLPAALSAFRTRRFERCKYIVERSKALCDGQIGKGPLLDTGAESRAMYGVVSAPL